MPEVNRRDLLIGAGAAAAAAGVTAAVSGEGTEPARGASHPTQGVDVSHGTPTLPRSRQAYRFRLTREKPTVTTPGGTVTEADENSFPVVKGNDAAMFYLVLKPGALREPHWHPNAWELDFCVAGRGELGIVTPGGKVSITTLEPGDIGFVPQGWAHFIRNVGPGDMKFAIAFNNSAPNDIGLSTIFGGMPTDTFSQTLGLPASALDDARKTSKTLLVVARRPD